MKRIESSFLFTSARERAESAGRIRTKGKAQPPSAIPAMSGHGLLARIIKGRAAGRPGAAEQGGAAE
ncbi:hypothetical protein [Desulfurivibrio sp. C05AmB]|uniref:hypothetical protein n=1 Tax=Desulfurivibrio sp. C05AmB TaxID=3374371 RepID=UPI00376F0919